MYCFVTIGEGSDSRLVARFEANGSQMTEVGIRYFVLRHFQRVPSTSLCRYDYPKASCLIINKSWEATLYQNKSSNFKAEPLSLGQHQNLHWRYIISAGESVVVLSFNFSPSIRSNGTGTSRTRGSISQRPPGSCLILGPLEVKCFCDGQYIWIQWRAIFLRLG